MADLQDFIYTTIGVDNKTTIDNFYLRIPKVIPDVENQMMFNESNKKNYTLSFDSWATHRKTVDTGVEFQLDIGSPSYIISPKCLIAAHQTGTRAGPANICLR